MTLLKLLTFKAPKKEVDNQSKIGSQVMENNLKWLNKIADASVPKIEKSVKSSTKKASKRPSNSSTKPNQDRRKVQKREGDHSPSGTPSSVGPATLKLTTRRSIEASNKTFSDHDEAKENSVPEPPKDRRKILKKVGQSNPATPVSDSPATSSKSSSSKDTNRRSKEIFSENHAEVKETAEPPQDWRRIKKRGGQSTPGTPGSGGPAISSRSSSSKLPTHLSKETFSENDEAKEPPKSLQDRRTVKKRGGQSTPGNPHSSKSISSKDALSDNDEAKETEEPPQNRRKVTKRGGQTTPRVPSTAGPETSSKSSNLKGTTRRSKEAFSDNDEANETPEPPQKQQKVTKRGVQTTLIVPSSAGPATSSKSSSSKSTTPCRKEAFYDNDEAKKTPEPPQNRQKVKKRGGQSTLGTPGSTTPAASPRTNSSKHTTCRSKETFSDDEETKITPEPLQDQRKVKKRGGDETPGISSSARSSKINRSAKRSKKEFSDHDETEEKNLVPNNSTINVQSGEFLEDSLAKTPTQDRRKVQKMKSHSPFRTPNPDDVSSRRNTRHRRSEAMKSPATPEMDTPEMDTPEMDVPKRDTLESDTPVLVKNVAPPCSELTKSPALPEVDQSDLDTLETNTSEQDKREMVKPETLGKDLPFVCVLPDCGQRFAVKRVSC